MKEPKLHESVFIADGAKVLGDVVMGEDSSVWYNAVIRADNARVTIGKQTNIFKDRTFSFLSRFVLFRKRICKLRHHTFNLIGSKVMLCKSSHRLL